MAVDDLALDSEMEIVRGMNLPETGDMIGDAYCCYCLLKKHEK